MRAQCRRTTSCSYQPAGNGTRQRQRHVLAGRRRQLCRAQHPGMRALACGASSSRVSARPSRICWQPLPRRLLIISCRECEAGWVVGWCALLCVCVCVCWRGGVRGGGKHAGAAGTPGQGVGRAAAIAAARGSGGLETQEGRPAQPGALSMAKLQSLAGAPCPSPPQGCTPGRVPPPLQRPAGAPSPP